MSRTREERQGSEFTRCDAVGVYKFDRKKRANKTGFGLLAPRSGSLLALLARGQNRENGGLSSIPIR